MPKYYKSTATVWNNNNSWSAVSSVSLDNAGIPSTTDDVIFDATSGIACAVSTSGAILFGTCRNFTTTGYPGTITLNVELQVVGPTIIVANTTFLGSAWFTIGGQNPAVAKTMNSNGVFFPNFQLGVFGAPLNTITFNDVLNVGNIRQAIANGIVTNGSFVNVNGSMTMESASITWTGTTVYNLVGTGNGNFGMSTTNPTFGITININKTGGTITFLSNVRLASSTFTYIGGNVDTTTNSSLFDLYFNNSITSKNVSTLNEILFNNVRGGIIGTLGTTTLGSDMRVLGNFTVGQNNGYNFNGNIIYVRGNILNPTGVTNGGTSVMVMEGSVAATISGGTLSRSLTINKTGGVAVTVVVNGVTGLSYGGTLLVPASQTLILSTSMILGGGTFDCSAGTFTPNLQTVSLNASTRSINMGSTNKFYNLTISATGSVVTMLSNLNITNNFTITGTSNFNGAFDITVGGDMPGSGTVVNTTPLRKLIITGTSTNLSTIATLFTNASPQLEINCESRGFRLTGTLGVVVFNYLATNTGSFITTGSTMRYYACTINMNGKTVSWNILNNLIGVSTCVITSDVYCVTFGPTIANDIINSSGGSFNIVTTGPTTGAITSISGTAGLRFEGSSNTIWNQNAASSISMRTIEFAKTLPGTVSIPNSFTYTGILKWVSGAVTHAATLTLNTGSTVNTTSAVPWNNITIPAGATITISSLFYIVGTLAITSGTTTFTGTFGWTCGTLTCSTASSVIVLQSGVTYTTTVNVIMLGTALAGRITMRSNTPTATYAIWTLQNPASQSMTYVNGQGIDSRPGMTIYTFGGDILTSQPALNWSVGASQGTKAFTFVS